jgi:hypothetical protein
VAHRFTVVGDVGNVNSEAVTNNFGYNGPLTNNWLLPRQLSNNQTTKPKAASTIWRVKELNTDTTNSSKSNLRNKQP